MFFTSIEKTEEMDITPDEMAAKGRATVQWMIGEPEGAKNFEMRYFSLKGEVSTEWHVHDWEHEIFVVKGKGKIRSENNEQELEPGDAAFVPPGVYHHFVSGGELFDFICVVPKGTRAKPVDKSTCR